MDFLLPDLELWLSVPVKIGVGILLGIFIWKIIELPIERYKASKYGASRRAPLPVGKAS
jgi:hypothetical protein